LLPVAVWQGPSAPLAYQKSRLLTGELAMPLQALIKLKMAEF